MNGYLGEIYLYLSFIFFLLSPLFLYFQSSIWATRLCYRVGTSFMVGAFANLIISFLTFDSSLILVSLNSEELLSPIYKLGAVWTNHEGSIFLFTTLLSVFGLGLTRRKNEELLAQKIGLFSLMVVLFISYMIFISNPFMQFQDNPNVGRGINPLLHDPSLLIHPPILYMGFAATSLLFAITFNTHPSQYQKTISLIKPWAYFSWMMLTLGIVLGSFWAYYELGWGGWWFWDPVENLSLMPWLLMTALAHLLQQNTYKIFMPKAVLRLSSSLFVLVVMAFFLSRSNLISSVHSFVLSQERSVGLFLIWAIILILSVPSLIKTSSPSSTPVYSRQDYFIKSLLIGSIILFIITISGTLLPMIGSFMSSQPFSLDEKFYTFLFIPVASVVIILMSDVWRKKSKFLQFWMYFMGALMGGVFAILSSNYSNLWPFLLSFILSLVVIIPLLIQLWNNKIKFSKFLGHLGLSLSILAMGCDISFKQEADIKLKMGESANFSQQKIYFNSVAFHPGPMYDTTRLEFILNDKDPVVSEQRFYHGHKAYTNETGLFIDFLYDIHINFIKFENENQDDYCIVHIQYHPMALWLWIGGFLISIGILLGLLRYFIYRK